MLSEIDSSDEHLEQIDPLNQRDSNGKSALDLALRRFGSNDSSEYGKIISQCLEKVGAKLIDRCSNLFVEAVCVVCMDAASQIVFYPCLHVSTCKSCFAEGRMTTCTNCRVSIMRTVQFDNLN